MNTPRILLIDDSKATRSIISRAFASHVCEITEAANGLDGITLAAKIQPQLIILDMTMPVMSGVEALSRLKKDPGTAGIPVIVLTANANPEEIALMRNLGAADYITKVNKPAIVVERSAELIGLTRREVAA